ncbi:MAG: M56 family metallopeptidase, partial [Gemmatimonadaceae bacterium]
MIATWMAYTTLITACAAIAAAALEPLARSRGIASRWVWVSALVASCVIPVAMAVRPTWNRSSVSLTSNWVRAAPLSGNESVAYASLTPDGILAVVWVAASGLMLLLVLSGVLQLRRSRARAERASVAGESVAVTADVGPGAVWFGEPRIVLPRWACSLGDDQTSLLVRHEREHVRAGDPSLLASALGLLVLAPWNLPLWFISRRMRAAIEIDCDARVLAEGGDVRRYGELLLTVAARRRGRSSNVRPLDALLPFAEPASPLERRIRAMTDRRPKLSLMRRLTISAIVCVAVVA